MPSRWPAPERPGGRSTGPEQDRPPGRARDCRTRRIQFAAWFRPLTEVVEAGWVQALEPVADRIAAVGDFLRAEVAAGRTYLLAGGNVPRAFKQPFADARVLTVGQDPYPTR